MATCRYRVYGPDGFEPCGNKATKKVIDKDGDTHMDLCQEHAEHVAWILGGM